MLKNRILFTFLLQGFSLEIVIVLQSKVKQSFNLYNNTKRQSFIQLLNIYSCSTITDCYTIVQLLIKRYNYSTQYIAKKCGQPVRICPVVQIVRSPNARTRPVVQAQFVRSAAFFSFGWYSLPETMRKRAKMEKIGTQPAHTTKAGTHFAPAFALFVRLFIWS